MNNFFYNFTSINYYLKPDNLLYIYINDFISGN